MAISYFFQHFGSLDTSEKDLQFGYEVLPHKGSCKRLDPHLVTLFWAVLETVVGRTQLEEVGRWGGGLWEDLVPGLLSPSLISIYHEMPLLFPHCPHVLPPHYR